MHTRRIDCWKTIAFGNRVSKFSVVTHKTLCISLKTRQNRLSGIKSNGLFSSQCRSRGCGQYVLAFGMTQTRLPPQLLQFDDAFFSCWVCLFVCLLFANVLPEWDFSHGKFGLPSPEKASCDRVALPNLRYMLGVLVFPESTEYWHALHDL